MLPTTDSKTISDSQISTIEITTKQEQSTKMEHENGARKWSTIMEHEHGAR